MDQTDLFKSYSYKKNLSAKRKKKNLKKHLHKKWKYERTMNTISQAFWHIITLDMLIAFKITPWSKQEEAVYMLRMKDSLMSVFQKIKLISINRQVF